MKLSIFFKCAKCKIKIILPFTTISQISRMSALLILGLGLRYIPEWTVYDKHDRTPINSNLFTKYISIYFVINFFVFFIHKNSLLQKLHLAIIFIFSINRTSIKNKNDSNYNIIFPFILTMLSSCIKNIWSLKRNIYIFRLFIYAFGIFKFLSKHFQWNGDNVQKTRIDGWTENVKRIVFKNITSQLLSVFEWMRMKSQLQRLTYKYVSKKVIRKG